MRSSIQYCPQISHEEYRYYIHFAFCWMVGLIRLTGTSILSLDSRRPGIHCLRMRHLPQESWGSRYLSKLVSIINNTTFIVYDVYETRLATSFCCDGFYFSSAIAHALSRVLKSQVLW